MNSAVLCTGLIVAAPSPSAYTWDHQAARPNPRSHTDARRGENRAYGATPAEFIGRNTTATTAAPLGGPISCSATFLSLPASSSSRSTALASEKGQCALEPVHHDE